jgi:hypothetical protein
MRVPIRPRLRDLSVGDKFYPASKQWQKEPVYEVKGPITFSNGHGAATRECRNIRTGESEKLNVKMEVIKIWTCLECGCRVDEGNKYCSECEVI